MHANATNMDSHSNSPPPPTTHQDNARDHDHEPLSPVFADSAIDMDVSPPPPPPLSHVPDDETLERTVRLADRLADLAHRTADKKNTATDTGGNSSRFSKDDAVVLQRCLDTIQKTLLVFDEDEDGDHDDIKEKVGDDEEKDDYDPRPGLTHELTKYRRPQSPTTTSIVKAETETQPASSSSPQPPPSLSENSNDATTEIAEQRERQPQQEKQFTALLDEVSTLGSELDQRRNESFYIYNLFTSQTQRLERRVSLLEDEIRELHADILQNSIEREGLRGTVYGLESWVDGCQQDHQRAVVTNRAQAQKKRWTKKRRPADNLEYDSESEALFEGITAWMRGWKDIDEGFRVRERERELRREERAKLRLEDVDANGDEESGLQHRTNFHFLMQTQQAA